MRFLERDFRAVGTDPAFLRATVVYTYLLPEMMTLLRPVLFDAVARGVRVVTFYYHYDDVKAQDQDLFGMLRLYSKEKMRSGVGENGWEEEGRE